VYVDATVVDFSHPLTRRIVAFIRGIGLDVVAAHVEPPCVLPGITIVGGALHVDEPAMTFPGDLLHEAGHLALTAPGERAALSSNVGPDGGAEMAAIAWSYAAAVHLDIDAAVVFHAAGYKGGAIALIENFSEGRYVGVPMLQYYGLCREKGEGAYPQMIRWVR
jgi:hypothetical protein